MVGTWTSSDGTAELLLALDRDGSQPLHRQLTASLRDAVRSGRLAGGSPLPSSRRLAADLGLSRGVVVEAYAQLAAEGYLVTRPGGATRVATDAVTTAAPGVRPPPELGRPPATVDFRYGRPDVTQFPRAAWLRSLRRVLTEMPHDRLTYLDGRGALELREALAAYLNRVRGTWATPDAVVVCNGFAQGSALALAAIAASGRRTLAVEDPSDPDGRRVAATLGLEVVAVPVDVDGIDVHALAATGADAVLVTPAHQFPMGGVLPPARRAALLDWARERDAVVVEDDYDAEYRYGTAPAGALQGLAPERVLYAGSASKTLAPGLRLGWLVVPSSLLDAVVAAKVDADRGSPAVDQLAFADFLERGEFDRHLRRMRPRYRARRDALLAALAQYLPELRTTGASAGLHVVALLPPDLDEAAVVAGAAGRGVDLQGLHAYAASPACPSGLVFGYGKLAPPVIEGAVHTLAEVVAELRD